jgi:hypothetical protein
MAFVLALGACSSTSSGPIGSTASSTSGSSSGGSSSGGSTSGGACANIAGSWSVGGSCGPTDTCEITQTGCSATFRCDSGGSFSGSVTGNTVRWSGLDGDGAFASCTGSVAGSSFSGTCTSVNGMCYPNAFRQ